MPCILLIQIQLMKSKYLDIKKFKQTFDPLQNDKNSRKQTKPKRTFKHYARHENQTQSEFQGQRQENLMRKTKFPFKKTERQIVKSQRQSLSKNKQTTYGQNSSNNQMDSNKEVEASRCQRSFKSGRHITDTTHQQNFIGQLDSYLKDLKRSKINIKEDKAIGNQTLLLNKLSFLGPQKPSQTIQKSSRLQTKIKKQKSINRNLQKCIIQIQKVLWDRNDQLEILQEEIRNQVYQKQNSLRKMNNYEKSNLSKTIFFNKDYANKNSSVPKQKATNLIFHDQESPLNRFSKISQRQKPSSILFDTNSDTQRQSSATFKQKRPRRKTETPINIEKIISQTLSNKGVDKAKMQKAYNRFQKHELNDI